MYKDYIELTRMDKPIGTLLLLWPTLWSLFIAANGIPPFYTIIVFSFGVFLTRSAGCAINDVFDAKFDKYVKRTARRPIAIGKLTQKQGIYTCVFLSLLAFALAYIGLSLQTLCWSLPALIIFLTYPLMKRFFILPQAYLGVAFSFGILMGFVEITGGVSGVAVLCFLANLFWVLGYDTIYALIDKEDDLFLGIKTSAITLGNNVVWFIALCYALFIGLQLLIGLLLKFNTLYYLGLVIVTFFLIYQIKTINNKERYFPMFLLNNKVGILVCISVIVGVV